MKYKIIQIALGLSTSFIALTAIGGGIAILVGADEFPMEWIADTPFPDYTIPALILAIVVGGSSLLAAVTIFAGHQLGAPLSMIAGLIMAGYIAVEAIILKQEPPSPTTIEVFYFGLGLAIFGFAAYLRRLKNELTPNTPKSP